MSEPAILGTIRASSWPTLFDCALRFYYRDIMQLKSPSSGRAALGTALHCSTAVYDLPRLEGKAPNLTEAADALVESLEHPHEDVAWDDDLPRTKAEAIGLVLTRNYAERISSMRTYRAVEVKCDGLDIATEHGTIRLQGTTDRVRVTRDGAEGICDVKSGGQAVSADGRAVTKGHHLQTGVYKLMAEHELGRTLKAPDEIIGLQVSTNARVGTAEIGDSRTPLIGDDAGPGLIDMAARMLKTGTFPPNPRSMLCSAKYCPGHRICRFHD